MAAFSRVLLFASCIVPLALCQAARFQKPPEASAASSEPSTFPVHKVGDILEVTWTTSVDVVDLIINQITVDGSDGGSKFDLAFNNQFNFMIFKVNSTSAMAVGSSFNISSATVDRFGNIVSGLALTPSAVSTSHSGSLAMVATTSSIPSSSSTSTTSSPATTAESSKATPTIRAVESEREGIKIRVKVGLGVGLGGGGAAVIVGLAICYRLRKKCKKEEHVQAMNENKEPPEYKDKQHIPSTANDWTSPAELHGQPARTMHPSGLNAPSFQLDNPSELPS
ncbi:hypothetical protein BJ875DRAFT_517948 [Amylocarpus encephaloides]|uniref:Mid2 domain-containing protein n=1 Tax=Amylocarpus encephaloides TaxID=45428 RepID=A0A9P7YCC8_9HELO|nr:hypothetical protein BJ875DRAFT_517948 [Amylocarpus encephaloides]